MAVRTGKRSSCRSRGRDRAARRGSGSDDTSDEDYRLASDGEVSASEEEDELEVLSDEEESGEQEGGEDEEDEGESSGEELGFEDEDEDFTISPVRKRKSKVRAQPVKRKAAAKKKRARPLAKKKRSGGAARRVCEEDGEEEPRPQRRVRKGRRFGGDEEEGEGEDGDDADFSPEDEDEEEEDDFDEEELDDEGEDEDEDLEEDEDDDDDDEEEEEEDESNDEEDEAFVVENGSRRGSATKPKGRKKRKSNLRRAKSGAKRRKRSRARSAPKQRRRMTCCSDEDEDDDDEDFVVEDDDDEQVEEVESGRSRKPHRSTCDGPIGEEVRRIVRGLVQRPRTGLGGRSRQGRNGIGTEGGEPPEKRICGVCLSEERKSHVVGLLNSCSHFFCFTCIQEWSKVESRCPVCKQRFSTITKTSGSDLGVRLRQIVVNVPKRDQVYQPSEEEVRGYFDPYANVVCIECQQSGEDTLMLLCDTCNSAAHTYCVGLGREVPEGDWYCDACRLADYHPPEEQNEGAPSQQVANGSPDEAQRPQSNSNRTDRPEIDMNMPYIPSPERPANVADESYLRTPGPVQPPPAVQLQEDAGRAPPTPRFAARQPAFTVSERRALHQRIQSMFTNNWQGAMPGPDQASGLNPNQPMLLSDLDPLGRYFF